MQIFSYDAPSYAAVLLLMVESEKYVSLVLPYNNDDQSRRSG